MIRTFIRRQGKVVLNPAKRYVQPYTLLPDPPSDGDIVLPAGGTSPQSGVKRLSVRLSVFFKIYFCYFKIAFQPWRPCCLCSQWL